MAGSKLLQTYSKLKEFEVDLKTKDSVCSEWSLFTAGRGAVQNYVHPTKALPLTQLQLNQSLGPVAQAISTGLLALKLGWHVCKLGLGQPSPILEVIFLPSWHSTDCPPVGVIVGDSNANIHGRSQSVQLGSYHCSQSSIELTRLSMTTFVGYGTVRTFLLS